MGGFLFWLTACLLLVATIVRRISLSFWADMLASIHKQLKLLFCNSASMGFMAWCFTSNPHCHWCSSDLEMKKNTFSARQGWVWLCKNTTTKAHSFLLKSKPTLQEHHYQSPLFLIEKQAKHWSHSLPTGSLLICHQSSLILTENQVRLFWRSSHCLVGQPPTFKAYSSSFTSSFEILVWFI